MAEWHDNTEKNPMHEANYITITHRNITFNKPKRRWYSNWWKLPVFSG